MSVIRAVQVSKRYGKEKQKQVDALSDISIEIEKGKVTAIGGPSGSGKTTLLSIIGLLTKPTQGKVFIEDTEVSAFSEVYRTKLRRDMIGFIFQANYLLPHLTSVQNVALPKICTDMTRFDAERQARDLLVRLEMGHRLDFRVAELSGGEQQRVSIARALMNDPRILIADEPSSSMDEELTNDLLNLLRDMTKREGLTVIVASHDRQVLDWADVLYVLKEGKLT